jgi:hypothetical protein
MPPTDGLRLRCDCAELPAEDWDEEAMDLAEAKAVTYEAALSGIGGGGLPETVLLALRRSPILVARKASAAASLLLNLSCSRLFELGETRARV